MSCNNFRLLHKIGGENVELTIEEKELIQHLRSIEWGRVTVEVKGGRPVMGHETVKDVKYTK